MTEEGEGREKTASEIASEGGKARAKKLSGDERKDIAQRAAAARWGSSLPVATHGSPDHPLRIGESEIPCYVLNDGRRVLHQRGMVNAIGMSRGSSGGTGGDRLAKFVAGDRLKDFVSQELRAVTENPVKFRVASGHMAYGYEATVLADICDAVLAARKKGLLQKQQAHIAEQCEILLRGFARVGIIALVDEATGYQELRDRQALEKFLDMYLRREFAAWAKRFPDEFYREIFRLRGWKWRGMKINRPQCVANYTKDLVYSRLSPGILKELEARNPPDGTGQRKSKHHQWLTDDIGHPALSQHFLGLLALMRASDTWDQMTRLVNKSLPKRGDSLQLSLFDLE
jgi:hypothetical protein